VRQLEQLPRHRLFQAVNARDAIADRDDGSDFGQIHLTIESFDLLPKYLADLVDLDLHAA
jgi:hypothetical protein